MSAERRLHGMPVTAGPISCRQVKWRREQLIDAGFDEVTARRFAARADLDLHMMLSLLDEGCSPGLAARIMTTMVVTYG